jgi:hypothetical protein
MSDPTRARIEPPQHLRGVDGWHWCRQGILETAEKFPRWWSASGQYWWFEGHIIAPATAVFAGWHYECPCPTPGEVEALARLGESSPRGIEHSIDYPVLADWADAAAGKITNPHAAFLLRAQAAALRHAGRMQAELQRLRAELTRWSAIARPLELDPPGGGEP